MKRRLEKSRRFNILINTNESGFPLYYGKIEKNNGDGTLSINVVCQTRGRSKDPVILTAPANKVHKMKS